MTRKTQNDDASGPSSTKRLTRAQAKKAGITVLTPRSIKPRRKKTKTTKSSTESVLPGAKHLKLSKPRRGEESESETAGEVPVRPTVTTRKKKPLTRKSSTESVLRESAAKYSKKSLLQSDTSLEATTGVCTIKNLPNLVFMSPKDEFQMWDFVIQRAKLKL